MQLTADNTLPLDGTDGALLGRIWRPELQGPSVVALRDGMVLDISASYPTVRDVCEAANPAEALCAAPGDPVCSLADLLANCQPAPPRPDFPWLLAPCDLQAIKAAGVTFATSMLERVIEEKARGNPAAAAAIRTEIEALIGDDLSQLQPGSEQAMALKQVLMAQNAWSQYLEVGIGPDAEIFTKAPTLAAVGCGAYAGMHPASHWNNPEPEVVLAVNSRGQVVGGTLGNDVNLRDIEGRSALLLGKAKDNNASAAIGPFIRLFDASFSIDDVRRAELSLRVEGEDGFVMDGYSSMAKISRDPLALVTQLMGPHHQYPDGAMLFLGTLFAPVQDRDAPGSGFTHKVGDTVTISSPKLGTLRNRMQHTDQCPPWTFGVSHLMRNLAQRGLL
jgi:fumarylacetoacetate (FAA) hydrolase family protein